jgi:hypothetical protein
MDFYDFNLKPLALHIPTFVNAVPPDDGQIVLETYRG